MIMRLIKHVRKKMKDKKTARVMIEVHVLTQNV